MARKMFALAYKLHWGYHDLMTMPPDDLNLFYALLIEQQEREEEAVERAKHGG